MAPQQPKPNTPRIGRPLKYTAERAQKVIQAIQMGASYKLAAAFASISEDTLSRWRARSADFADTLARAEGSAAVKWLAIIDHAADADWRAAAWKLERRYPQDYGRTVQEHQGRDGAAIQIENTDARDRLLFEVEERRARIQEVPRLPVPDGRRRG